MVIQVPTQWKSALFEVDSKEKEGTECRIGGRKKCPFVDWGPPDFAPNQLAELPLAGSPQAQGRKTGVRRGRPLKLSSIGRLLSFFCCGFGLDKVMESHRDVGSCAKNRGFRFAFRLDSLVQIGNNRPELVANVERPNCGVFSPQASVFSQPRYQQPGLGSAVCCWMR